MLTVRAPAKLNLDLRVGAARADGFHPISSWFATTSLRDTLTFGRAEEDSLACDDPSIPTDERNLVVRALRLVTHPPVKVMLAKRIPAGGGLGGGSSDAAATLLALSALFGVSAATVREAAEQLGSDVPFFLGSASALCTGRGEVVDPLPAPRASAALLVLPGMHVSTPEVFRAFDALPPPPALLTRAAARESYASLASLASADLLAHLHNDLETATFRLRPELGAVRRKAEDALSRPVRMSGSGSTLFTLYDTRAEATRAASAVRFCATEVVALCAE